MLEYAERNCVRTFVTCSTEKAATPNSVMGTSKLLIEGISKN
ncbi:MAG: hypothetical protein DLM68_18265, partial [Hyphomicrobiales bacterium]